MHKTPKKQMSPVELPATPVALSHAPATAAQARELLEGARMALRQASDTTSPPTSRFSKIQVCRTWMFNDPVANPTQPSHAAQKDHVQTMKTKHDSLLPRKPGSHATGSPSGHSGVRQINNQVSTTPISEAARSTKTSQSSIDCRIQPLSALPTAIASSKPMSARTRAVVLKRKKQHLSFLLNEQERLIREVNNTREQLERLPDELKGLQKEIDDMEGEGDLVESSDDDWLHSVSKIKTTDRRRDV